MGSSSPLDLANTASYSFRYRDIFDFFPRDFLGNQLPCCKQSNLISSDLSDFHFSNKSGASAKVICKDNVTLKSNLVAFLSFLVGRKHTSCVRCVIPLCFMHLTGWTVDRKITSIRPASRRAACLSCVTTLQSEWLF